MTNQPASWRFADSRTRELYPAPIVGPTSWQPSGEGWSTEVVLGDLPAGTIVAPSLSVLGAPEYQFSFELHAGQDRWLLPPVPNPAAFPSGPARGAVKPMIDCWHVDKPLPQARVRLTCTRSPEPERYLLTVSARPLTLAALPPAASGCVAVSPVPRFSQMLENPRIAGRICSPMSLAMTLAFHRPGFAHHELLPACRDPLTGMYGLWPLAIVAASRHGLIGAVELLSGWDVVLDCLATGLPVIASIRYGKNQLPGIAQPGSSGHLVVVHSVTPSTVHVNDPAAPDHGAVLRECPIDAFTEAWFRHRGAAYILLP